MKGPVYTYLASDHDRLDALLARAEKNPDHIDPVPFAEFRAGLLRHIGMEERVLLPETAKLLGVKELPIAARLRLDHGALTALLVPSPTRSIIATIRSILRVHNALEEQEGGAYHVCEEVSGTEGEALLARLKAVPAIPVHPHNDKPEVLEATKRAVSRAGYTMQ